MGAVRDGVRSNALVAPLAMAVGIYLWVGVDAESTSQTATTLISLAQQLLKTQSLLDLQMLRGGLDNRLPPVIPAPPVLPAAGALDCGVAAGPVLVGFTDALLRGGDDNGPLRDPVAPPVLLPAVSALGASLALQVCSSVVVVTTAYPLLLLLHL